jgi:Fe-S cluster assembly scaffold protein SufB
MLNPEHILYLRSRGIPEQEAAKILIEGMISEFFNKEEFNFERDIIDSWVKHS